jgi:hypothetical protein
MADFDPYKPPAATLEGPSAQPSAAAYEVPASVITILGQARPWVTLFVILFAVAIGVGLLALVVVTMLGSTLGGAFGAKPLLSFLPLVVILLLYVPPMIFLARYAAGIKQLQNGGGLPALEHALRSQKSFWKYIGIFGIVMIGIYALAGIAVAVSKVSH